MNKEAVQKIRWLQQAEGHSPCFKTGQVNCVYRDKCCWACFCKPDNPKAVHRFNIKEL